MQLPWEHMSGARLVVMAILVTVTRGRNELLDEFDEYELFCPDVNDRQIQQKQIPWGVAQRAYLTLPDGLVIANSTIPEAGLGVYTWQFIPRYTWLGAYEGEVVVDEGYISSYTWQVRRSGASDHYIDGHDITTSNWLRFINCSRGRREENVDMFECKGRIYYMAVKDLHPGTELLIYYGDAYADQLGIDTKTYENR